MIGFAVDERGDLVAEGLQAAAGNLGLPMPVPAPDLPSYAEPLFEPRRSKVLYGGRGGARSWSAARALLTKGARSPLRILCARELQVSIKDSVHRLLTDQADALGLPYYSTQSEIRHPNGTVFIFSGIRSDPKKIKSFEGIDICWIEEAENVSDESWNILIPTIRKPGSEIWVTFNPDLETDPTYQRFVVNPPPGAWVHHATWRDNPWFPEELRAEKEYLERVDPDAAAWVWDGMPRRFSKAQILHGKWAVEDFEIELDEEGAPVDPGWSGPYHGSDFGFAQDPTTAVRLWTYQPWRYAEDADGRQLRENVGGPSLYVEHESYGIGLELDDTGDRWKADVPGIQRFTVRADSSRPESISYLRRHGIPRIVGVPKWKGSVEDGIAHLRQYERIVIHTRCPKTKEEARLYSFKVDKLTGDVLPIIVDKHNHIWDAVRYALEPRIKRRGLLPFAFAAG